jgi:fibronectin type 3 domain-containing protein
MIDFFHMKARPWHVLLGIPTLVLSIQLLGCFKPEPPHIVTLTWQAPAPQSGITVVGYNVYRRVLETTAFVKIADRVTSSPYDDRFVTTGTTYIYVVTSVDATGRESRYSLETKAQVPGHHYLF